MLSPDAHDGAWIKLEPDAVCAITRDYLIDPVDGRRAPWRIDAARSAAHPPGGRCRPGPPLPGHTHLGARPGRDRPHPPREPNTVDEPYPVPSQTFGWAAGDAAYAMGTYELANDEALVIEGRSPACAFWNVCLWNQFLHTYDYAYERVTLNGGQVVYEPDGSWRIVVAPTGPGPSQLDLDRRSRAGPDLVPLVPPRADAGPAHRPGDPRAADPWSRLVQPTGPGRPRRPGRPRFPPEIDQLAWPPWPTMAAGVSLEPDALWPAARSRPGSTTSATTASSVGSRCCARALRAEAGPERTGRRVLVQPTGAARSRTGSSSRTLLTRHPEIHDIEITRPIIIAGLPRTGTTHLHNLLGADPALRSLPYWESLEPVLAGARSPGPASPIPGVARTALRPGRARRRPCPTSSACTR